MAAQMVNYPDYTIIVKIFHPPTKQEKLAAYFGSRKRGGGGEIKAITYPWRSEEYALIEFDSEDADESVVRRVCRQSHINYKVKPYDQESPYGELETPLTNNVLDALRKKFAVEEKELLVLLDSESVSGVRFSVKDERCIVTGYWHQLQAFQNYISGLLEEPRLSDVTIPLFTDKSTDNQSEIDYLKKVPPAPESESENEDDEEPSPNPLQQSRNTPTPDILEGAAGGTPLERPRNKASREMNKHQRDSTQSSKIVEKRSESANRPHSNERQKKSEAESRRKKSKESEKKKSAESRAGEPHSHESWRADEQRRVDEKQVKDGAQRTGEKVDERCEGENSETFDSKETDTIYRVPESNVDKDIFEFLSGTSEFAALQASYPETEIEPKDDPENLVMTELVFISRSKEDADACKNIFVELLVTKAGSLTHDVITIESKDKSLVSKIPKTNDYTFRLINESKIKVTAHHNNIVDAVSRIKAYMSHLKRQETHHEPEPGPAVQTTHEEFKFGDLTVKLIVSDITRMRVDMIVNAANGYLKHDGGLARAIALKLSSGSIAEGEAKVIRDGIIQNGHVWVQKATGQLAKDGIKWLTHAVGPMWVSMGVNKMVEKELADAVFNSLEAADRRECFSIALPLISSGIFGVPPGICARSYLLGLKKYLNQRSKAESFVKDVYFVDIKYDVLRSVERQFQRGLDSVQEKSLQERTDPENQSNRGGKGRGWRILPERQFGAQEQTQATEDWLHVSSQDATRHVDESGPAPSNPTILTRVSQGFAALATGAAGYVMNESALLKTDQKSMMKNRDHCSSDDRNMIEVDKNKKKGEKTGEQTALQGSDKDKAICPVCFGDDPSTFEILRPCAHIMCRQCIKRYKDMKYRPICPRCTLKYVNLPGESNDVKITVSRETVQQVQTIEQPSCPICCDDDPLGLESLRCSHVMCRGCLKRYKDERILPKCPRCNQLFSKVIGQQPDAGQMTTRRSSAGRLPGYENYGMIEIHYTIPSGIQQSYHPNPGQHYSGTSRVAYLPDTRHGQKLVALLRKAFDQKLIFTVGQSVTTGADNQVVWNNIHHKTSYTGNYGYPDPTYLERLEAELNAVGIN